MADYDRYDNEGGGGFMMGLLTGTVLGAGLGMLLAPKAGDLAAEVLQGERAAPLLGGRRRTPRPVGLPELPGRALVLVDKTGRTPPRYPRGGGLPATEPLGMARTR